MSTARHERRVRGAAAIALAALSTLALAAPALAKPEGNSAASAACEDGGYLDWTDADGNAFRNAGACVSYAAHGGTLVPVVVDPVNPFSVSYERSGTNGFVATLTGTGLDPDSGVDLVLTWGDENQPRFFGGVTDGSGAITLVVSSVCTSLGSPVTAVGATGMVEGEFTEYTLPLPGQSCLPA